MGVIHQIDHLISNHDFKDWSKALSLHGSYILSIIRGSFPWSSELEQSSEFSWELDVSIIRGSLPWSSELEQSSEFSWELDISIIIPGHCITVYNII